MAEIKDKLLKTKELFQTRTLLHTKILRLLIGSILTASLMIGMMGVLNAGVAVRKDSAQIMKLLSEEKTQEIDLQLQTVKLAVESVYHYADEQLVKAEQLVQQEFYIDIYCEKVYVILQNAAESTDCAMSAYMRINPDLLGKQKGIYITRQEDGSFADHAMTEIVADSPEAINKLSWYYLPIANAGPTWLEPYWDANVEAYMTSYVIPIFYEDEPIAVVGMDIDLSLLREIVSGVSVYEHGHAFLISAEGDVIYHKDYPEGVEKESFDASLKKLVTLVYDDAEEGEVYSNTWNGKRERLVYSKLMNGMFLAISAPTSEINRTRNILMCQLITMLLIIMTVSISFSTRLARQITKPLAELTNAARKIAEGDWNTEIKCNSRDETGVLAVAMKNMMAELNKQLEHIHELAYSDTLTGLYNRHFIKEYFTEYAHGEEKDVGVIFCDLNRLKYVNDNFGHSAGDGLICGFTDILKKVFPKDVCCRMSGDEFLVIVLDCTEEGFARRVEVLRKMNTEGEVPMAAIGCCYKEKAKYIGEMMNEAEDDMYRDKQMFYQQYPMYKR